MRVYLHTRESSTYGDSNCNAKNRKQTVAFPDVEHSTNGGAMHQRDGQFFVSTRFDARAST